MSEKLPNLHEKQSTPELESSKLEKNRHPKSPEDHKKPKHEHSDNLENIRKSIDKEALPSDMDKEDLESESNKDKEPAYIGKDLLEETYKRTQRKTRQKLSMPMKGLSKIAHNPVVETISELGEKTIARPSGILTGGIIAFIGSGLYLIITKHYGYEYNFLLFAILFVGGYLLGVTIEMTLFLLAKKKQ